MDAKQQSELLVFRQLMVNELEVLDQQLNAERDGDAVTEHSVDFWLGAKQTTEDAIAALDVQVGVMDVQVGVTIGGSIGLEDTRRCCNRCSSDTPPVRGWDANDGECDTCKSNWRCLDCEWKNPSWCVLCQNCGVLSPMIRPTIHRSAQKP